MTGGAAVFLDRDGVLNRALVRDGKAFAPRRLQDFRLLPGSAAAVATLRRAGFPTIVVTNQPDIGNKLVDPAIVAAMNDRLRRRAPVDDILVCPHGQTEGCSCRKPKPGLLRDAAARHGIDLSISYMVGDRWSDVAAGRQAGCFTILIDRGYREGCPERPDAVVATLPAAVALILARSLKSEEVRPVEESMRYRDETELAWSEPIG
ncbi:D-alpha,beta-D-heptose 1,7-bisphosphate phosphatase [Skermanella stibiiresistens SB22]|uniref:D,D-heptose 1,7-bisphosphate phosphatase n=1 Tax=Skermanella stibiiresistens SB22 TaxID=1385369 RepID=W9H8D6_9PROT|nr:HAD family hydrolase [Skermanella stibiiresistens]EWY42515.1 D-alpha,beta-D-heptose 1,7-bisphosphate phosphatase [Skermanella stibiiresistens SB22]